MTGEIANTHDFTTQRVRDRRTGSTQQEPGLFNSVRGAYVLKSIERSRDVLTPYMI